MGIVTLSCLDAKWSRKQKGMDDLSKITSADSVGCSLSNDVILDKISV